MLVVGQEVWEEWTGQSVEETEWRKEVKGQWREMEQAVLSEEGTEQGTWGGTRCMTGGDRRRRNGRREALVAPCHIWSHFYCPLSIVNLFIYSIKVICSKTTRVDLNEVTARPLTLQAFGDCWVYT